MTYIDIHVLQSVPPSNLNRDDTGSPKTAVYGGVRRARVSSQAWKRATRKAFAADLDPADVGYRTTRVVELVAGRIKKLDESRDDAVGLATDVVKAIGLDPKAPKISKKRQEQLEAEGIDADLTPRSDYLVFLSASQIDKLAEFALGAEGTMNKRAAKAVVNTDHGVDVGLFGRMIADDASLNVDSAVQVAHAISTHAVDNEFDYYTAVDDSKKPEEDAGAGMIGTIEFNSATLYRYATINVAGLVENLGAVEAASRAAEAFVRAFVTSMPTGKQNTFANRTLPEVVVVMVRDDQPVNLVGAFEDAVRNDRVGYVAASAGKLAEHAATIADAYGNAPRRTFVLAGTAGAKAALGGLGEPASLDELVRGAGEVVG